MPENTEILTGEEAIDHMVDTWRDLGMGMVNLSYVDRWLVVRRAGGDYATLISLVDGTAVTITEAGDTVDVPDEHVPDQEPTQDMVDTIEWAFDSQGGGSYPLPDDGVFSISFESGDGYKALHVGLLDDTFEIVDE